MKLFLSIVLLIGIVFSSSAMAQVKRVQPWDRIAPLIFCSSYNRLVIDYTPIISDNEIIALSFYEIEAYTMIFIRQFIIENRLSPEIELIEMTNKVGERAKQILTQEMDMESGPILIQTRFAQCMETLINAGTILGLRTANR
jgi:hypothetical protein